MFTCETDTRSAFQPAHGSSCCRIGLDQTVPQGVSQLRKMRRA
jgi:hypothetical protein